MLSPPFPTQAATLEVNFNPAAVQLFKEVRTLVRLNVKIPIELKMMAKEVRDLYPFAVRLEEVIRMYNRTCALLDTDYKSLAGLAATHKRAVQERLSRAFKQNDHMMWLHARLKEYVEKLSDATVNFQDRVRLDYARSLARALPACMCGRVVAVVCAPRDVAVSAPGLPVRL